MKNFFQIPSIFKLVSIALLMCNLNVNAQSTGNTGGYYGPVYNTAEPATKNRYVFVSASLNKPQGVYGQLPLSNASGSIFETYEGKNGGIGARTAFEYTVSWLNFKGLSNLNASLSSSGMGIGTYYSVYIRYNRPLDWTPLNWSSSDLKPYVTFGYEIGPSFSFLRNKMFLNPFFSFGIQSFPGLYSQYSDISVGSVTRQVYSSNVIGSYYAGGVKVIAKFQGFYALAGINLGHCTYTNVTSEYYTYTTGTTSSIQSNLKMPNSLFVLGVGVGTK